MRARKHAGVNSVIPHQPKFSRRNEREHVRQVRSCECNSRRIRRKERKQRISASAFRANTKTTPRLPAPAGARYRKSLRRTARRHRPARSKAPDKSAPDPSGPAIRSRAAILRGRESPDPTPPTGVPARSCAGAPENQSISRYATRTIVTAAQSRAMLNATSRPRASARKRAKTRIATRNGRNFDCIGNAGDISATYVK